MTGYIINPAWFYWINVIDAIRGFLVAIIVLSSILCVDKTAKLLKMD